MREMHVVERAMKLDLDVDGGSEVLIFRKTIAVGGCSCELGKYDEVSKLQPKIRV
jgi:hypothetical protein